jgi:hypothetical protein
MNDASFGCADVDALAAELALGIVSGAERAAALEHLAACSACRARVDELAEVADDLLLLGPEREPSAGFESRVLTAIGVSGGAGGPGAPVTVLASRRRRISGRTISVAAAALIVVGAIGAFIGNWVAPGQSRLTQEYVAALHQMGGSALGAERLQTVPGGQVAGEVFAYEGKPSWLFVSVWDTSADNYTVRLIMKGGTPVTVAALQKIGDGNSLGADVTVDITKLERAEIVDRHGTVRYQATFTLLWPKWSSSGP